MKNFPLYIAGRYLVSKKSHNAINIISLISVVGVGIGTMGLIIVLSVFNGFGALVLSLYNTFDPDLRITPATGKTFIPGPAFEKIKTMSGVVLYGETLEETVLLRYRERQYIATVKGVGPQYAAANHLDSMIIEGKSLLADEDDAYTLMGSGIAYALGVQVNDAFNPVNIYLPRRGAVASLNPEAAFVQMPVMVSGVFAIQQDFDTKYTLLPLRQARELLSYEKEVSAIELKFAPGVDEDELQKNIMQAVGKNYVVKNRLQQHDFLYKILRSEKLAVYLILSFILLIAVFNVIGSLTMLIIEKKKDITVLWSMGADAGLLRNIFLAEGMMISLVGAVSGLLLGFVICFAQQTWGLIDIGSSGSFVVNAYPVQMQAMDFVYVFATVVGIGFVASWYPARQMVRRHVYSATDLV